jgi:GTP-binding protein
MTFGVNTSPFAGREGTVGDQPQAQGAAGPGAGARRRAAREPTDAADTFLVSGRGELHLAILIETMRREGYEFQVSAPEVILHEDPTPARRWSRWRKSTSRCLPYYTGVVVEMLGPRKGPDDWTCARAGNGTVYYTYLVPTRGLLGFRQSFLTATRGMGIVHSIFHGYEPHTSAPLSRADRLAGGVGKRRCTSTRCSTRRSAGKLFIGPGVEVYEGMIVGRARPTTT